MVTQQQHRAWHEGGIHECWCFAQLWVWGSWRKQHCLRSAGSHCLQPYKLSGVAMILSTPAQDGFDYVMEEETLKIPEAEKQHDCVAVASDNLRQESSQVPMLGPWIDQGPWRAWASLSPGRPHRPVRLVYRRSSDGRSQKISKDVSKLPPSTLCWSAQGTLFSESHSVRRTWRNARFRRGGQAVGRIKTRPSGKIHWSRYWVWRKEVHRAWVLVSHIQQAVKKTQLSEVSQMQEIVGSGENILRWQSITD